MTQSSGTTSSNDLLKFPTIPLIVGVLSGLLTAEAARFLNPLNPLVGVVFGPAMTLLVWLKYKSCSAWLAIALIASSVTSYLVAVWATSFLSGQMDLILGPDNSFTEPFGPGMFSVAGFLGSMAINLALLLLLSPPKGPRVLAKAAAWSCAGAFLGLLSSELSEPVGATLKPLIGVPATDMGSNDYYLVFYSAYLIWQTGMAFLIPFMLPHSPLSAPSISIPRSPAKLSIFGKVFFFCIFATLAVLGCLVARDQYRKWKVQHKSEKLLREPPSSDNLGFILRSRKPGVAKQNAI